MAAETVLRAPWIVRRGQPLPSWIGGGNLSACDLLIVPVARHQARVFGLDANEVDEPPRDLAARRALIAAEDQAPAIPAQATGGGDA